MTAASQDQTAVVVVVVVVAILTVALPAAQGRQVATAVPGGSHGERACVVVDGVFQAVVAFDDASGRPIVVWSRNKRHQNQSIRKMQVGWF